MDKTVFNRTGHRMQPHNLVHRGFVAFDCIHPLANQFLDELRARRPVFDQDSLRIKQFCLLTHGPLQFRIAETLPNDLKQIKMFFLQAPGSTDAVIA